MAGAVCLQKMLSGEGPPLTRQSQMPPSYLLSLCWLWGCAVQGSVKGTEHTQCLRMLSPPTQSREQDSRAGICCGQEPRVLLLRWVHMRRWMKRGKGQRFEITNAKGFLFLPWLSGAILRDLYHCRHLSPLPPLDLPWHLRWGQEDGVRLWQPLGQSSPDTKP